MPPPAVFVDAPGFEPVRQLTSQEAYAARKAVNDQLAAAAAPSPAPAPATTRPESPDGIVEI
jgi:hypothetical protein